MQHAHETYSTDGIVEVGRAHVLQLCARLSNHIQSIGKRNIQNHVYVMC